jgi:hypothetical protein
LPELISGTLVYDGQSGADKTPAMLKNSGLDGAYNAVADFNGDGHPDLVLVKVPAPNDINGAVVAIYDWAGDKFLLQPFSVGEYGGGPPTVADFDGDGAPEFGFATSDHFWVIDPACVGPNKPADCDPNGPPGVLWSAHTRDHSSSVTTASAFDFNGDGAAEVVYRDECWLRVFDGKHGHALLAANVTSTTALEMPPVADVDGDGHADVVIGGDASNLLCPIGFEPATGAPWLGYRTGLFIYSDPLSRWLPARPLWNQHAYHVTNIADDLTVPAVEPPSWAAGNDYRAQHAGAGPPGLAPGADLTAGLPPIPVDSPSCANSWTLRASVCNRGAAIARAPVPGTFYTSDPRKPGAQVICSASTTLSLPPGACQEVSCDWPHPPNATMDLWFRVNDDGTGRPGLSTPVPECRRGNDVLFISQADCLTVQ